MTEKPTYEELEKRIQELEQAEFNHKQIEEQLSHSRDLMDYVISNARSAIAVHDRDLNYVYVSKRYLKEYKVEEHDVIGKHHYEIFPDLPQKWRDVHQRALAGEVVSAEEDPYYRKDGSVDWTRWECRPWYESNGSIGGIIIYTEVINERKKVEESLRKSEQLLATHLQNTPIGALSWDLNFKIVDWNPAAEKIFGYSKKEAMDRHPTEIILHDDMRELVDNIFQNLISEKGGTRSTNENRTKNGSRIICDWYNTTLKDADGKVIGVASLVHDITERKEIFEALKEQKEFSEKIVQTSKTIIVGLDKNHKIKIFNRGAEEILGFKSKEVIGKDWFKIFFKPDIYDEMDRVWEDAWGAKFNSYVNPIQIKNGSEKIISWQTTGMYDSEDDTKHMLLSIGEDLTERIHAEDALKESEEKYRRITENAKDMIYRMSLPDGNYEYVSPASLDLFGYLPEEFYESPVLIQKIIHPAWIDYFKEQWVNLLDGNMSPFYEYQISHKSGETKWMNQRNVLICDDNGQPKAIEGIVTDVTQRKKIEQALKASEKKYRSMMTAMKDPVYICSNDYQIEYMNPAMIRNLGRDATGEKCFKAIHDLDEICTWCMHDKTSQNECFEYTIVSPRNNRHYQIANTFIVHEDGSNSKMTVFKDITDLIMMEDKYHQAQKMESVGRLAGGVAHDFNNALSVIKGFTEMALDDTDPKGQLHEDLNEIHMAANRAADITRQLLAFARKQTIAPTILDLNENVESILKMLRRLIGEDIDFAWLPGANLWSVNMDPTQIDQILANLCVNARDAIEGVGKLTIESENVTLTNDYCIEHTGFIPGKFVKLSVSDNGCGMNKEVLDNIFEPFFTTKDVGKGTGLGLATVYGIVKQNNGFINVYSEPDIGTTIKIYLPMHEIKAVEDHKESIEEIPISKGETVLVVEDDPSILNIMQKILENFGYKVLTSSAPEKTKDIVKKYTNTIHLLITDVIMPKMNGRDLAEQLQIDYPDLKCIFMSGYTADAIAHQGVLDKKVNFIQKPFSRIELAEIVRKVLDEN